MWPVRVVSKLEFALLSIIILAAIYYNFLEYIVNIFFRRNDQIVKSYYSFTHNISLNDTSLRTVHIITTKVFANPPKVANDENFAIANKLKDELKLVINGSYDDEVAQNVKKKLSIMLSKIVQSQLKLLQNPKMCSGLNLLCGHQEPKCGFGCQIHHRVGCLIVSYALGIPLIHDDSGWPYTDKWTDVFLPLGSKCSVGSQTYRLIWNWRYPIIYKEKEQALNISESVFEKYADQIKYPLKDGIPVSKEIAELVEFIHPNPFVWWIGQFFKFGLRITESQKQRINVAQEVIQFHQPIIGVHVRRTDKVQIMKHAFHEVNEYINAADEYYKKQIENRKNLSRSIFLASDDVAVVISTMRKYSRQGWKIIGFESRTVHSTPIERSNSLFEVVADVFLLSQCDFIVCDFSSNICTLLMGMKNYLSFDGADRVKSLKQNYTYKLLGGRLMENIIKVNS